MGGFPKFSAASHSDIQAELGFAFQPDEHVLGVYRGSWLLYVPQGLLLLWGLSLSILIGFDAGLVLIAVAAYKTPTALQALHFMGVVTNQRIVVREGFLGRRLTEIPLADVQSVGLRWPWFWKRFKLGEVVLTLPGQEKRFRHVAGPALFFDSVNGALEDLFIRLSSAPHDEQP